MASVIKDVLLPMMVLLILSEPSLASEVVSLCEVNGCVCDPNALETTLVELACDCQSDQTIKIGSPQNTHGAAYLPENVVSLVLNGCSHLEAYARVFNHVPHLRNVSVTQVRSTVFHQRMFESRNDDEAILKDNAKKYISLLNFDVFSVQRLQVKRHSFEGIEIKGKLELNRVVMERVPSLAFNLDSVNEFRIQSSRFDRVSMWGFKLERCNEFNVLHNSKLFSLASRALKLRCNKFTLANSTFNSMQDSSLSIAFGFADIRGNLFQTLAGKPFVDLRPTLLTNEGVGFVFSENKFAADPTLPFDSLSMPEFGNLVNMESATIAIESNHFLCDCDRVAWFVRAMTHSLKKGVVAREGGSLDFLKRLYYTSGQCLRCNLHGCQTTDRRFKDFAKQALITDDERLPCSRTGGQLQAPNPEQAGNENSIFGEHDDKPRVPVPEIPATLSKSPNSPTFSSLVLCIISTLVLGIKIHM